MGKKDQVIIDSVINWFEKAVLGLNLCPFAAKPYRQGSISFKLSHASDDESCLTDLLSNINKLRQQSDIETLVLIIADHLQNFSDYNEFLGLAELLLEQQGWNGIFQIASFHPDYVFANCDSNDRANWTNRSPYPLLHIIQETSISKAVESHANIDSIPQRNIQLMRSLSEEKMKEIFN